jgi:hypothetical protein
VDLYDALRCYLIIIQRCCSRSGASALEKYSPVIFGVAIMTIAARRFRKRLD